MTRSTRWAAVWAIHRPAHDGQNPRRLQLKTRRTFFLHVSHPGAESRCGWSYAWRIPSRASPLEDRVGTRCQLISQCSTAAARGVLLDSGGENAYARGVCRQAIEKSPFLLCDDLGRRASCPPPWARKTSHATTLSPGEQAPCSAYLRFATTRSYPYAKALLLACPRRCAAVCAPPRLDSARIRGPRIAWFRPPLLRLSAGSALRASLAWNI